MPSHASAVSRGSTVAELARVDAGLQHRLDPPLVLAPAHAELLGALGGERGELVEEHPDVVGIAVDDVEQLVAQHRSCADGDAARRRDAVGAEHHLVHHPIVDRGEQLLLRPDVVVERALAEAVDLAQLGDAGGVVAAARAKTCADVSMIASRRAFHFALRRGSSLASGGTRQLTVTGRYNLPVPSAPWLDRVANPAREGQAWTGTASTGASRSSRARDAASAAPTRACSPTGARASSSTTSAARWRATAPTPRRRPPSPPRSSPRAAPRSPTPATWPRPAARRRSSTPRSSGSVASTSWSTTPASSGGPASRRPTRTTSRDTSRCTSAARSTPPAPRGRTWSSRATAAS